MDLGHAAFAFVCPARPGRIGPRGAAVSASPPQRIPLQWAAAAHAQFGPLAWPDRLIRLIVPVSPGGSLDPLARLIARHLGETLGQPVVVENHAGAGGNLAFEMVARAAPDGGRLLVGWDSLAINPALFPKLGFDPLRDFAPILRPCAPPSCWWFAVTCRLRC